MSSLASKGRYGLVLELMAEGATKEEANEAASFIMKLEAGLTRSEQSTLFFGVGSRAITSSYWCGADYLIAYADGDCETVLYRKAKQTLTAEGFELSFTDFVLV